MKRLELARVQMQPLASHQNVLGCGVHLHNTAPGVDDDDAVYIPEHNGGMISILTLDGERLARWGDGPVNRSCHGIWVDSHDDLYVVQPGEWGRVRRVVKYERQ